MGLLIDFRLGLAVVARLLNCLAVIPMYLDAREPGVMVASAGFDLAGVTVLLVTVEVLALAGTTVPGVVLPTDA